MLEAVKSVLLEGITPLGFDRFITTLDDREALTRSEERSERAALRSIGITHTDDIQYVRNAAKRLGIDVEEAADDEFIKNKLERMQATVAGSTARLTTAEMMDFRQHYGSAKGFSSGNRDAAIAHARAAQFAQPESPQRRLAIAGLFAELGVDDEAGSLIATVEGDKGAQAKVWELRGRIAEQKGDLSDAIELYRRAVLEGGGAEARLLLASALREAGLIDESIAEYQQIGAAHRDVGLKVTLRLARLAVDLGRFDKPFERCATRSSSIWATRPGRTSTRSWATSTRSRGFSMRRWPAIASRSS
jgi:predicted negative regulator of RcsB-dependent stress response